MLPQLNRKKPWFAFLLHARESVDLYRMGASSFLQKYSDSDIEFRRKLFSLPPLVVGQVTFGLSSPITGDLVASVRMPEAFIGLEGIKLVGEAGRVAIRRGASVIGLGALTAPVTQGGALLVPYLPPGVTLTNGNGYTAVVVRHNVLEAVDSLQLTRPACVAVVGGTGSVGAPACRLLAQAGLDLILVGKTEERVREVLGDLVPRAIVADNLDAVRQADIVVLLTSHPAALLQPQHVDPGTIVIDFCGPPNIPSSKYGVFEESGIIVREGGLVHIPQYSSSFDMGVEDPSSTYACLAETYLFAVEGIREHSVGQPSLEHSLFMERVARRHRVTPCSLRLERSSLSTQVQGVVAG